MRFFIFVDRDTVLERQRKRQDNEEEIKMHMTHYDETMNYKKESEHAFENYDLPQAAYQISEVIEAFLDRDVFITD